VIESLRSSVRAVLAAHAPPGARIAVGLSGGVDSVVLLDLLHELAPSLGCSLSALHVNHGISPNAASWAEFCATLSARLKVPIKIVTLQVKAGPRESLEAQARAARYEALRAADADFIALAHHQDDQAETLLLQLLRGAGPRGLAAMPVLDAGQPALLRPLLAATREQILAYARARGLEWIDDESNRDIAHKRNYLRERVTPLLRKAFPGYPATLARSAEHCAESAALLDALAAIDLEQAVENASLSLASLRKLDTPRAKNALRAFIIGQGLPLPSSARLSAWWTQLQTTRPGARITLKHGDVALGVAKDRLIIHTLAPPPFEIAWRGEPTLALVHGQLRFERARAPGLSATALDAHQVTVRSRVGGERLRPAGRAHHRSLKHLMQEAHVPAWSRSAWPLLCVDGALAAIPGIAVANEFAASMDEEAIVVTWLPNR
jgi:tRNA(Ile)-lysidine synthase